MKNNNRNSKRYLKNVLSFLMSMMLLCGNLVTTTAFAQDTQYYSAEGWVILAPTATPAESAAPDATVQAGADDITFATLPEEGSAIFGATLSVDRVSDDCYFGSG